MSSNDYEELTEKIYRDSQSEIFQEEQTAISHRENFYLGQNTEPTRILPTVNLRHFTKTSHQPSVATHQSINSEGKITSTPRKSRLTGNGVFLLPIISIIALSICGYNLYFVLPEKAKEISLLDIFQSGIPIKLIPSITLTIVSAIIGLAAALASIIMRKTRWLGIILTILGVVGLSIGIPYTIVQLQQNTYAAIKQDISNNQNLKNVIAKTKNAAKEITETQINSLPAGLKDFKEKDIPVFLAHLDKLAKSTGIKTREIYLNIPDNERNKLPKEVREIIEKRLGIK